MVSQQQSSSGAQGYNHEVNQDLYQGCVTATKASIEGNVSELCRMPLKGNSDCEWENYPTSPVGLLVF